ncbi:MAG: 50S ribosomal protein L3 [Anaerolineae bacterium SM23_84]|nr:MAG: 50S ribosomal protein L3 [Anaerolineae bacterium SM23_84]
MAKREGLLGRKMGMSRIFDERGENVPITVIEAGPCYVTQIKTVAKDGYNAIQLGFGEVKPKRLNRPQLGHLKALPPLRHFRELRTDDVDRYQVGQKLDVSLFEVGELVDVVGISKGRGFAGVMKRHGFGGGTATHGQSDRARAPGSIGPESPGWVRKGQRMPGRMGSARVTAQNLRVVSVDAERNLVAVKGGVPGAPKGLLLISKARKL